MAGNLSTGLLQLRSHTNAKSVPYSGQDRERTFTVPSVALVYAVGLMPQGLHQPRPVFCIEANFSSPSYVDWR